MSRTVPSDELELLVTIICEHPEGLGIANLEEIAAGRLPKALSRRTLQRRLARLVADERIITEGESIALVYKAHPGEVISPKLSAGEAAIGEERENYVPVSHEGGIIRELVRRSLMQRRPVGYQRSFLDEYEPGVSFYLPESIRADLKEMGHTPSAERRAGTYAREIANRLLIDLSWASSRLEGNTYNHLDTKNLIEFGQAAAGKDARETQMILNHKAAIEMFIEEADQIGFNFFTFQNLHALLADNLLADENACGRLRRRPVDISGSVFHPLAMPQVLEECFRMLLRKASAIQDPFEQAFFIMVQLPYLQPFEDVNKRVSRLGANISLFRANLCPLSFIDVPERAYVDGILGVYELNQVDLLRDVFIWAYERSCQRYLAISRTMADPDPLRLKYREQLIQAVQKIVRGGKEPSAQNIEKLACKLAAKNEQQAFGGLLRNALEKLHEGNVVRYRLRLSEFMAWKSIRESKK